MSAVAALRAARLAGVTVWVDAGALALEAAGEPPASVLDLLARHKKEIIALLTAGPTHPSGCGVVPANDALITAPTDSGLPPKAPKAPNPPLSLGNL